MYVFTYIHVYNMYVSCMDGCMYHVWMDGCMYTNTLCSSVFFFLFWVGNLQSIHPYNYHHHHRKVNPIHPIHPSIHLFPLPILSYPSSSCIIIMHHHHASSPCIMHHHSQMLLTVQCHTQIFASYYYYVGICNGSVLA